jgi:hypothetical protein
LACPYRAPIIYTDTDADTDTDTDADTDTDTDTDGRPWDLNAI